jgi:hypothetical protein
VQPSGLYRLFIGWVMMGLGVEVEIGVCVGLRCTLCPESHPVFCKYISPEVGGGLHFRFPWRTEWIGGCCLGCVGSL